jgi:tetratricopeptide (TPR) repeat protein
MFYDYLLRRGLYIFSSLVLVLILLLLPGCKSPEQKHQIYLERAQAKFDSGDFNSARVELLNALENNPSSSQAYFLMGKILTKTKNYEIAAKFFAYANKLSPGDREIALHFGRFLFAGNAYQFAESIAINWVHDNPEDTDFLFLLSLAQAQQGKVKEARDSAERAVKILPENIDAWLNMGHISLIIGDREGVQGVLSEVTRLDPTSVKAGLLRISLLQLQKKPDEAVRQMELLSGQNPENSHLKIRLAQLYYDVGDKDKAIVLYREISKKDPQATILSRLGSLLYESENISEAVACWNKSIETDQYYVEPRLALVRHYFDQKEVPRALEILNKALEYVPYSSEAHALRGEIYLSQGNSREAVKDFQSALENRPDSVNLIFALAQSQLAAGETIQARENLRIVLEKEPGRSMANLLLARIEASAGNLDDSSLYAQAVSTDKEYGREAMWILADNNLRRGRISAALAFSKRNLQRHKQHPATLLRLARSRELLGDLKEAEFNYRSLVNENPSSIVPLAYLVNLLERTGRMDEALSLVRDKADKGVSQRLLLGLTLEKNGLISEARDVYLQLIDEKPDLVKPYHGIVNLYAKESKLQQAEQWLIESISNSSEPQLYLLVLLGMVQDAIGKKTEAMDSYRKALDINPESVPVMNNLAWNLMESSELEEALKIAARARNLSPDEPYLADTYAWILHISGDSAGALLALRTALEALPENETIRMHMIEVLKTLGREDEVRRHQEILDNSEEAVSKK